MDKYFINECKCDVAKGICGPGSNTVVATVKYTKDNETKWLTNIEVTGLPGFYITDKSIYEKAINNNLDEQFINFLESANISQLDGIRLDGDYDDITKSLLNNKKSSVFNLVRFLIALTRCNNEKIGLINKVTGKYVDDIDMSRLSV